MRTLKGVLLMRGKYEMVESLEELAEKIVEHLNSLHGNRSANYSVYLFERKLDEEERKTVQFNSTFRKLEKEINIESRYVRKNGYDGVYYFTEGYVGHEDNPSISKMRDVEKWKELLSELEEVEGKEIVFHVYPKGSSFGDGEDHRQFNYVR